VSSLDSPLGTSLALSLSLPGLFFYPARAACSLVVNPHMPRKWNLFGDSHWYTPRRPKRSGTSWFLIALPLPFPFAHSPPPLSMPRSGLLQQATARMPPPPTLTFAGRPLLMCCPNSASAHGCMARGEPRCGAADHISARIACCTTVAVPDCRCLCAPLPVQDGNLERRRVRAPLRCPHAGPRPAGRARPRIGRPCCRCQGSGMTAALLCPQHPSQCTRGTSARRYNSGA